jgi:putative pyruvate formate lyase activating enzyme
MRAQSGQKIRKIEAALAGLRRHESCCRLCPRDCGADRSRGQAGFCRAGPEAAVSHALLHFGEEPVLSGHRDSAGSRNNKPSRRSGSGTIFFAGCNLKCSFCQNYQLSWLGRGRAVRDAELARMMLELQTGGALNINLVSPTHLLLPILRALRIAYDQGLRLPVVYNSGGYERADVLACLDGIVDIYLPDLKYLSCPVSAKLSGAPDYFEHAGPAIKEMFLQRPVLLLNNLGIAREGLIIRHLVLPGQTQDSLAILDWLARELSTVVSLSLMSQFRPCFKTPPELNRQLHEQEYQRVLARAEKLGFENVFIQPAAFPSGEHLVPDFDLEAPFNWRVQTESR